MNNKCSYLISNVSTLMIPVALCTGEAQVHCTQLT